jgi:hypothetical protein
MLLHKQKARQELLGYNKKKLSKYKKSSSIPTIVDNGTFYKTDEEKTQIFKKYLEEAFKDDQNADYDSRNFQSVNEWYNDFFTVNNIPNVGSTVIEEEYYANLNKGKNTSPGFDLISRSILRRLHADVRKYILKVYNYCIENCYFPSEWKKGSIILITKPNEMNMLNVPEYITHVIKKYLEKEELCS